MVRLNQRHILVAISGGIAAYKGAELVRLLKKQGALVRVVLSRGATEFITPLTMQALSGEPTHTELLDEAAEAGMGHIELARWADVMIIAPATADVIARLAQGRADDLLTTVALATPAPVAVAPAMNQQMWAHARPKKIFRCSPRGTFKLSDPMRENRLVVMWGRADCLTLKPSWPPSMRALKAGYWKGAGW